MLLLSDVTKRQFKPWHCMYIYVCVCVCVCVDVYIYIYVCVCVYIYTTHTHTHIYMYIQCHGLNFLLVTSDSKSIYHFILGEKYSCVLTVANKYISLYLILVP